MSIWIHAWTSTWSPLQLYSSDAFSDEPPSVAAAFGDPLKDPLSSRFGKYFDKIDLSIPIPEAWAPWSLRMEVRVGHLALQLSDNPHLFLQLQNWVLQAGRNDQIPNTRLHHWNQVVQAGWIDLHCLI